MRGSVSGSRGDDDGRGGEARSTESYEELFRLFINDESTEAEADEYLPVIRHRGRRPKEGAKAAPRGQTRKVVLSSSASSSPISVPHGHDQEDMGSDVSSSFASTSTSTPDDLDDSDYAEDED